MSFATLLFYAASSFFLGLVAIAIGGAAVLQSIFAPGSPVTGGSHEPWQTILSSLVIAGPLVFLALAVLSLFNRAADAPATASEIRHLIAEIKRSDEIDPGSTDPDLRYRRP